MSTRNWTYALKIRGSDPASLPLSKVAEYLREFSALLGDLPSVRFAGLVKGSAVLRSYVAPQDEQMVQVRLLEARTIPDSLPADQANKVARLLGRDGFRAELIDRKNNKVLDFVMPEAMNQAIGEVIVSDSGTLDGVVVGIQGADDTVHVRLRDSDGVESRVIFRDLIQARELAHRFRGEPVRVYVHGTWKRSPEGVWTTNNVYADRFEDLDETSALDVFEKLRAIPGNGWSDVDDPMNAWRGLREGT
jgi:hypothetical protein